MDWDFEENIRLRGNWEDIRNPRAFRGVAVREKGKENEFSDANERGCSLVGERERELKASLMERSENDHVAFTCMWPFRTHV